MRPAVLVPADPTARRAHWALRHTGPIGRALATFDRGAYRAIRRAPHPAPVVGAIHAFSRAGEHGACWLALGAAGAATDEPRRDRWLRGLRAVGIAYVTNVALKSVVRRKRPVLEGLPHLTSTPTALSFPSSHAAAAFAAATSYADLVPGVPLTALAGSMAISRVYLGVHYPADVVAGALVGTAIGSVFGR